MVYASGVNPIKIKFITKGKTHTKRGKIVIWGRGARVAWRARLQMEKKKKRQARFEGTEGVPDCIALLFPPLVSLERAAGVKEETPWRPL